MLATGGGAYIDPDTRALLKEKATTVWLRADLDLIWKRVNRRDTRPLLMHSYFIRPGDPKLPIVYKVERDRDGASFTTRRIVAIQKGRPIFNMAASFQVPEDGLEHAIITNRRSLVVSRCYQLL